MPPFEAATLPQRVRVSPPSMSPRFPSFFSLFRLSSPSPLSRIIGARTPRHSHPTHPPPYSRFPQITPQLRYHNSSCKEQTRRRKEDSREGRFTTPLGVPPAVSLFSSSVLYEPPKCLPLGCSNKPLEAPIWIPKLLLLLLPHLIRKFWIPPCRYLEHLVDEEYLKPF